MERVSLKDVCFVFILILALVIIVSKKRKSEINYRAIAINSLYITFVLSITLLGREFKSYDSSWESLFLTYRLICHGQVYLVFDVVLNIVLFVPMGILFNRCFPVKKSLLIVMLFSVFIELHQLILGCGIFEICDIIDNTIGGGLGVLFHNLLVKVISLFRKKAQMG